MGFLLLAAFVTVPLVELYVLLEVGSFIGGLATVLLCLLTAGLGAFLVREQGLRTLAKAQRVLMRGDLPTQEALHGMLIAISGILLLTPGLITDGVGFALLIPKVRKLIVRRFFPLADAESEIIDVEVIDPEDPRSLP